MIKGALEHWHGLHYKRRTWKIQAKLFKLRNPWHASLNAGVYKTSSKEPTFVDNNSDEFWNVLFLVSNQALVKPFISVVQHHRNTKDCALVVDPVTNPVTIFVPRQGSTLFWWFHTITTLQLECFSFLNFYQTGRRFSFVKTNCKGMTSGYTSKFGLKKWFRRLSKCPFQIALWSKRREDLVLSLPLSPIAAPPVH